MVKSKAYALIKNHEVEYYVEDFARDIKEKDGVLMPAQKNKKYINK